MNETKNPDGSVTFTEELPDNPSQIVCEGCGESHESVTLIDMPNLQLVATDVTPTDDDGPDELRAKLETAIKERAAAADIAASLHEMGGALAQMADERVNELTNLAKRQQKGLTFARRAIGYMNQMIQAIPSTVETVISASAGACLDNEEERGKLTSALTDALVKVPPELQAAWRADINDVVSYLQGQDRGPVL